MWTRREFLTRGSGVLAGLAGGAVALRAQDDTPDASLRPRLS